MPRRPSVLVLAAVALLLLGACTSARRTEPLAPPIDTGDPVVARGRVVFFQHCHPCHPHGEGGLGPAIVNKPLPEFLMKFQVRHGLGVMPGFDAEKIPKDDLEALMRYLKAVRSNPAG